MSNLPTHLSCPKCGTDVLKYNNPFPTVDVIISYKGGVVLIKRNNPPFGWAIPGGFMEYGESAETTAHREMKEETNLEINNLKLVTVRSEPDRDPRFHTVTVVYTGDGTGELKAGDDAGSAGIFQRDNLPEEIAFDHREVLELFFNSIQGK